VDEESSITDASPDETWATLHHEYNEEIGDKDSEYDKLTQ
jgi:hypothetical protein